MELAVFFITLGAFCYFDIRSMLKAGLKKEILAYAFLGILAGVVGFIYLSNPTGESLSNFIMNLLKMKR